MSHHHINMRRQPIGQQAHNYGRELYRPPRPPKPSERRRTAVGELLDLIARHPVIFALIGAVVIALAS